MPSYRVADKSPNLVIAARERAVADAMATVLRERGYAAIPAYSVYEVLNAFAKHHIRFLLMDLQLPLNRQNPWWPDGDSAAEYIDEFHPDCTVVLMGGQEVISALEQAPAQIAYKFTTRCYPVHPQDLLALVRRAFHK